MRDRHIRPTQDGPPDQAALARRKLELEIDMLEAQQARQAEKLDLEISELRDAPRRTRRTARLALTTAALSVVTSLTVAGVGGYITWQVQQQADHQKRADRYSTLSPDLGSSNVAARAGAVVGLTPYAMPDSEQSAQTITILATQLAQESDGTVLRELMRALVGIGAPALNDVARANRAAYQDYLNAVQAIVATGIAPLEKYAPLPDGSRGERMKVDAADVFDKQVTRLLFTAADLSLLTRSEQAVLQLVWGQNSYTSLVDAFRSVAAGSDASFGLISVFLAKTAARGTPEAVSETDAVQRQAGKAARALLNTSTVLGRILRAQSGRQVNADVAGVALLFADLGNVSLPGIDLSEAFIAADAREAAFGGARFVGATLTHTALDRADLSYASFDAAFLPNVKLEPWGSPRPAFTDKQQINLTGANWWHASYMPADATIARVVGFTAILGPIAPFVVKKADDCSQGEITGARPLAGFDENPKQFGSFITILFCPSAVLVASQQTTFEAAFPRAANEKLRADWIARGSPIPPVPAKQ